MTPLVVAADPGHNVAGTFLVDIPVGYLISLLVGYGVWRRVRWTE
ncbi:hypothetical protein [Kribbella sp. NPDC051137]